MKKRNWLKTTIALLTLVATVLETGFTSVTTLAAEYTTDEGIVVDTDAVEETADADTSNDDLTIEVESDNDDADVDDYEEEDTFEEAEALKDGTLDVSDSGISGSGYDEISIYVDTEELGYKRSFRLEFTGPSSASYNPIVNDDLYKTNDGRYDFENLEGEDFTVRATSSDDVILSYTYNEDGYPTIVVKNTPVEKVLRKETVSYIDGNSYAALTGEGYDSVKIEFETEELSDKASYKLVVKTDADAKVDGRSVKEDITGLGKDTTSLKIEDLDEKEFTAYVVSEDDEAQIASVVSVNSVEDGEAVFTVDSVSTKRVYEYEDSKVKVTAILEKADAIPDDAYFDVTPLTEEEAQKYLEALNEGKDVENGDVLATEENTLLYNIGFYTDETKTEEIEPEEGSVRLSVEFKQNQLEEDLGVEKTEDVEVTHFKEEGSNIEPEKLELEENVQEGTIEVVTDSFSVFAFFNNNDEKKTIDIEVSNPGSETIDYILDNNMVYGIIADTLNVDYSGGDAESSFAVKTFNGKQGQIGVEDSTKVGDTTHYQYDMAGKINASSGFQLKGFPVYLTIPSSESGKLKHESAGYITENLVGYDNIISNVNNLLTHVSDVSDAMGAKDSVSSYDDVPNYIDGRDYEIDVTGAGEGTYYINVDKIPAFKQAIQSQNKISIKKNAGQRLVFNFGDSGNVNLNGFVVNGTDTATLANKKSSYMSVMEEVFFNFHNAGAGTTINLQRFVGTLIAPGATVNINGTSAGWLVCGTANVNAGEWHFNYDRVPDPDQKGFSFDLTKRLVYNEGTFETDVTSAEWPEEGFTFEITKYTEDDPGDLPVNKHREKDPKKIPDLTGPGLEPLRVDPINKDNSWKVTLTKDKKSITLKNTANLDAQWVWENGHTLNNTRHYMVFMYKIVEKSGNASNIIYGNENPQYVKIFMNVDKHGNYYKFAVPEIKHHWSVSEDGCVDGYPSFKNKLDIPKTVDVTLKGIKRINDGTYVTPDDTFEFTLYRYYGGLNNGHFDTGNKAWEIDGKKQVKRNKGNEITFDTFTLEYGKGTFNDNENGRSYYYYKIVETGCPDTYEKDNGVFIAKVTLEKDSDGNVKVLPVDYYRFDSETGLTANSCTDGFYFKESPKFAYNNTREATGTLKLYGTKVLEGQELTSGMFTFVLSDANKNKIDETSTIQNITKEDGTVVEDAFVFDESGKIEYTLDDLDANGEATFKYYVSEVVPENVADRNGITYDPMPEREITVTVKDVGTNTLKVEANPASIESPVEFINTYNADGQIVFRAKKLYAANSKLNVNKKFTFRLSGTGIDVPQTKPAGQNETAKFDPIKYEDLDAVGTYTYVIEEVIPETATDYDNPNDPAGTYKRDVDGIIYDARKYNITVVVSDGKNGKLVKTVKAAYDETDPEKQELITTVDEEDPTGVFVCPEFTNDYSFTEAGITVPGVKELVGHTLKDKKFTFRLAPYGTFTENAVKDGKVIMPYDDWTVQNDDNGNIYFGKENDPTNTDKIRFTAETPENQVYKFIVTEVKDSFVNSNSNENIKLIYSDAKFIVNVSVKDNGAGQLVATRESINPLVKGENGQESEGSNTSITFINTPVDDTSIQFFARKVLIGSDGEPLTQKELSSNKFEFELKDASGNVIQTKSNGTSNGTASDSSLIKFTPIPYTLDDLGDARSKEITYTMNEKIPEGLEPNEAGVYEKDGYIYDTTVHPIKVTLYLDDNDELKATADKAIVEKPEITFHNTYHKTVKYELDGYKEITSMDYDDTKHGFKANLYAVNGRPAKNGREAETGLLDSAEMKKVKFTLPSWLTGKYAYGYFKFTNDLEKYFVYDETDIGKTYTYQVTETGTAENITNDTTLFRVELTIKENDKEELYIEDKIIPVDTETNEDKSEDGVDHIVFTNHFNAEKTTYFEAVKELKNKELSDDNKFTFILEDMDGNEIATAQNNTGGAVELRNDDVLKYDQDDVGKPFYYRIYEKAENTTNYTYSEAVYIAKAVPRLDGSKIVVDNTYYSTTYEGKEKSGKDKNEVTVADIKEEVPKAAVKFTNEYTVIPDSVQMWAYKKLIGRDLTDENKFTFILKDEDGKEVSRTTNVMANAGEKAKAPFDAITIDQNTLKDQNTHKTTDGYARYYTIEEDLTGAILQSDGTYKKDGYTYDPTVYNVVVTIQDVNGKISADWYAYKEGETPENPDFWDKLVEFVTGKGPQKDATFTNEYEAEGAIELKAKKILNGLDLSAGDFFFTLKEGNTVIAEKVPNGNKVNEGEDVDVAVFDRITYKAAGEHTYTLEEFKPEGANAKNNFTVNGIHYDDTVYTIIVKVTDPGDGKLVVKAHLGTVDDENPWATSVEVTENGKTIGLCTPDELTFTNEYEPNPVSIIIGGNKVLTGRTADPATDKFSFTMKEGDNVVGTSGDVSLKADGTGTFEFPMITYTADDMKDPAASTDGKIRYLTSKTITYVISEDKPAGLQPDADGKYRHNGITYADDKTITVELSIDDNGQMKAKVNGAELTETRKNGTVVAYLAPAAASFVNEYAENSVTLSVKKIVDKVATPTGDTFTFNLHEGSVNGKILMTRSFVDDGTAHPFIDENAPADKPYTFKYTQAGTYTYYVEEVDEHETHPFYTYSDKAYKIVVTVTPAPAGSHELGISKKVTVVDKKTGKEDEYTSEELEFVNTPVGTGTFNVVGEKIFTILKLNKDKKDEKDPEYIEVKVTPSAKNNIPAYTFELIDKKTGDKVCADVKNATDTGLFIFEKPVEYTQEDLGTHTYILREVLPDGVDRTKITTNTYEYEGTTYDLTEHEVAVTVSLPTNNAKDRTKLVVTTTVDGQEINEAGYIAKVFGRDDPAAKFNNAYKSIGKIDPPIITKTIVGRDIMPGEFSFEVSGSYKLTSGENVVPKTFGDDDFKFTTQIVQNGIDPITKQVMKDRPGEIFVDNVDIDYMDLSQSKDGFRYDDYIIMAREVKPGNAPGEVTYSDTKLYLYVHAMDNGKGEILTSGHGKVLEVGGMPDGTDKCKLEWETEDGKIVTRDDLAAMIENVYLGEDTVKIPGSKVMIGRDLTDKEKNRYSFTLMPYDNASKKADTSKAVTISNMTFTQAGVGNFAFDGADGIEMLKYRVGTEIKRDSAGNPELDKDGKVQVIKHYEDVGDHYYKIVEKEYNENNIITDTRYYIVTVAVDAVEDAANKKVVVTADIKKDANGRKMIKRYFADDKEDTSYDPDAEGIKFENKYVASTKVSFAGIKKLVDEKDPDKEVKLNKQLAEKFTFELQSFKTEAERNRLGARGQVIMSATTPGNGGAYSMGPVEYTQDDLDKNGKAEFFYRIVETPPAEGKLNKDGKFESNGIIYDDNQYDIDVILEKIAVGQPDEGKIKTTVKVDGKAVASYVDGAGTVNKLDYSFDFKNPVKVVDIHGKKIWNVKNQNDIGPVTINLMANGVKINSTVAKAPDWTYEFKTDSKGEELQASDSRGYEIKYTVDEDVPPGCVSTVEIDADGNINFINTKGEIVIRKINADTGEALAGAVLAILDGSSEIESWTSEVAPHIVSATLTPGKTYTLREKSAPEGFEVAADVTFTVPSDGKDITVTMSDKPIVGSVTLIKADAANRERLAGAKFSLYKDNMDRVYATGSVGSYRVTDTTSNGVFEVNASGTLTIADLPYGTYYFVETEAPEGYVLSSERLGFTILRNGEHVEVTFLDPKAEGAVKLRKVGEMGTGALSGAVFELYSKTPRTIGQAAASTIFRDAYYRYGTYRTNAAGEIEVTGLPWDDYYFVEVEAPDGYEVMKDVNGDDIVYTFSVTAANATATVDLGGIVNTPTTPPPTPTPTPAVLGARVKRGGVVNGVLGVRAKPTSGVLGERIGPVTGDASNIILWLLLFTACVATIIATIVTGRKKKTAR